MGESQVPVATAAGEGGCRVGGAWVLDGRWLGGWVVWAPHLERPVRRGPVVVEVVCVQLVHIVVALEVGGGGGAVEAAARVEGGAVVPVRHHQRVCDGTEGGRMGVARAGEPNGAPGRAGGQAADRARLRIRSGAKVNAIDSGLFAM